MTRWTRSVVGPLFSRPVVLMSTLMVMAIGIGLSTALVATFCSVFLQPWPVNNAQNVVVVYKRGGGFLASEVEDLQRQSRSLSAIATTRAVSVSLRIDSVGAPRHVFAQGVSQNYFHLLGLHVPVGRPIGADIGGTAGAQEMVISHRLWQSAFASDPNVAGRRVRVNDVSFTIVGVAQQGWTGPPPRRDDVWIAMGAATALRPEATNTFDPCCVEIVGRLGAGVSARQAEIEIRELLKRRSPAPIGGDAAVGVTDTLPLSGLSPTSQGMLLWGGGAGLFILALLTGSNVVHVQLARAIERTSEWRTKVALGASVRHICGEVAQQTGFLAVVTGVLGAFVAHGAIGVIRSIGELDSSNEVHVGGEVLVYHVLATGAFGLLFIAVPQFRSVGTLHSRRSDSIAWPVGLNLVLLTGQIGFSVALIAAGSLLTKGFLAANNAGNFPTEGVSVATLYPQEANGNRSSLQQIRKQSAMAAADAGAEGGFVDSLPFQHTQVRRVWAIDVRNETDVDVVAASGEALEVLGIRILGGRPHRSELGAPEALISRSGSAAVWGSAGGWSGSVTDGTTSWVVTGVVDDHLYTSRVNARPTLYVAPNEDRDYPQQLLQGRNGRELQARLSAAVTALQPDAKVTIQPLRARLEMGLKDEKAMVVVVAVASIGALFVVTVGAFGICTFLVESRRKEIGIRMALGASSGNVLRAVFAPLITYVACGLVFGATASVVVSQLVRASLHGVSPSDPWVVGCVIGFVGLSAAAAAAMPIRRALAISPATLFRP